MSTPEHSGRSERGADGTGRPRKGRPAPSACVGCVHLYSTWDAARPRGCRAYGFRSARWPCEVVQHSSGQPCGLREPRPDPARARSSRPGSRTGRGDDEGALYG